MACNHVGVIGITCRLHDERTADDLGISHLPSPIQVADLAATEHQEFRVIDVIVSPPGSPIAALVKVRPVHLRVVAA